MMGVLLTEQRKAFIKNIIRFSTYMLWSSLAQFSVAGVPRLVLFPIAAYIVGKSDFGLFATALSVALIIGVNPGNGLAMGLLRNLAHYQDRQQQQLCSTAVKMCHKFLVYFLLGGVVVIFGLFISGLIDKRTYLCLTFLAISLYAENQFMLLLTPLRYERLFKEYALWCLGNSLCILAFGVIGCFIFGVVGLAFGIMSASFLMCWILAGKYYKADLEYDAEQIKILRFVWVQITLAGILALAAPHLNRITLRFYADTESVADLFAATAIAYIFIAPISNSSGLLLSMISRYKTAKEISGYTFKMLFAVMVGGVTFGMALFYWTAPVILKLLFPTFGDRASSLFGILIWMIPSNMASALTMSLITKFANVAWIPRINFSLLLVMLILMFGLIPRWGLVGAAWSVSLHSVFAAILQVAVFCIVYKKTRKPVGCVVS